MDFNVPEIRKFDVNGKFILPPVRGCHNGITMNRHGTKLVTEADLVSAREYAIETIHRLIEGVQNIDTLLADERPEEAGIE